MIMIKEFKSYELKNELICMYHDMCDEDCGEIYVNRDTTGYSCVVTSDNSNLKLYVNVIDENDEDITLNIEEVE